MVCREGDILKIQAEGVPLGLLPDREYDEVVFQAREGDLIILYSDGVSDHVSPAGEEYGRSSLARVVRRCCECPPKQIVAQIFADLDEFNTVRFDDQTLMVMRVVPQVTQNELGEKAGI